MLDPSSVLNDLALACLGLVVATLWQVQPAFIVPALTPLVLMYQALMIPQLKHLAAIDSKTGLANAGHFKTLAEATTLDGGLARPIRSANRVVPHA
jgi:hypothetical protein